MIIISQSDEAEGLQTGALELARGMQHFSHAVDGTRAGVESYLHEISGREFMLQLQQATGDRNGLSLARACCPPSARWQRDGSIELYARGTVIGIA